MRRFLPALLLVALAPAALAATVQNFGSHLTGDEEVPPRATLAQGQVTFQLDDDGMVSYKLIASNIENVVAAHIHCGPAGVNGPVIQFLFGPAAPGGGRTDGVLAEGSFDPSGLTCPDGASLLASMRAGNTYTNVHTNDGEGSPNEGPGDFPGGEIRGQIEARGPKA